MKRPRNKNRVLAGVGIWALGILVLWLVAGARAAELARPAERVLRYAVRSPRTTMVRLECSNDPKLGWVSPAPGDPLLAEVDRTYLGRVEAVTLVDAAPLGTPVVMARVAIDPEIDPASIEDARYEFETASGDMRWAIETLLPERKREAVKAELISFVGSHSEEIARFARPIGEDVLEHALSVVDANLTPALKRHEKDIQVLLDRHRGHLKEDLLPVLKERLGPSAKEKARPILTKIGRECWDALPMWDLGWSALRDKLPWQSKRYVDDWWKDFLETKAIPIVKEHEDELTKALEELVQEGLRDPKVRAAVSQSVRKLAKDPEFKAVVRAIIEESLVRPFDPQALFTRVVNDPGHRERGKALERVFAPTLQRIARVVAIDERREGLSPDLARVLRRVIFRKDQRWVSVATPRPPRKLS